MKRLIVLAAILMSVSNVSFGQDDDATPARKKRTVTESNFEMLSGFINIRDYVYLQNNAKMIIELNNVEQYNELKHLDTVLYHFLDEIAFYRDSLDNYNGNVRIDYTIDEAYPFSKIRFKKHEADGEVFMNNGNDAVAKLKLEQDTVRIFVRHNPVVNLPENIKGNWAKESRYSLNNAEMYQLTFCVNVYTDLRKIADDKRTLRHVIDTLTTTKKKNTKLNPNKYTSSTYYHPFGIDTATSELCNVNHVCGSCRKQARYRQYKGLAIIDNSNGKDLIPQWDEIELGGNIGAGLVRNYLAPYAEIGVTFTKDGRRIYQNRYSSTSFSLLVASHFLFEQGAQGEYYTKPNWFVNAQVGNADGLSMGAGYLFSKSGSYFSGTTVKAFMNISVFKGKGFTLSPELIITDDFRQVFPGLTIKVF